MGKRRERGTGELRQVNGIWKVRYTIKGRRVQESTGSKRRADAVRLLNKRMGQVEQGQLHAEAAGFRWADLERIILDEHKLHRSYEKVERHVRRHLRRYLNKLRAAAIDYNRLLRYKNDRLEEGASPSTVRYELSLIRTGLVVAHKAGLLGQLPPFPTVHVENTRTGFFERHQFDELCRHLPERVRPVVTFMYWTGWRRNEVLTREWRHVDFERGEIHLDPGETKNGKGRTLPFDAVPALAAILQDQHEYTREVERRTRQVVGWVFHREGRRVKSIRQAWRTACKKAGLVGLIPHDFRRTAVRNLVRAGVPDKIAMMITGHETRSVFERYNIVTSGDVRDGLAKLAAAQDGQVKGTDKGHLGVVNS